MKKALNLAGCVFLLFFFGVTQANSQPIVLKAVAAFPKNNLALEPVQIFIDMVAKRSQGKIKIDWVGGPDVIQSFDQSLALKAGTIDMLLYYPSGYWKSLMPEADALGLSELTRWEMRKTGAFELWCEIYEKRVNAKFLGGFHSFIPFSLYSNKKIETIGDFKGMKIRVMPLYVPYVKALGAVPVMTPPTEIYTSMERGVADAFMWPRIGMTSWGTQEVTKYTIEPSIFQIEPTTAINLDKWKKIPKDLQEVLSDVMQEMEYIASMRAVMIMKNEDSVREKAGMKPCEMKPEDGKKFRDIAYEETWKLILSDAPEYGPKLKELSSRKALPKGAFPWQ